MEIILFRKRQKFNVVIRRALAVASAALFCLAVPIQSMAQWTSPLKECWKFSIQDISTSPLASDNEHIFIPTSQGSVIALDQTSGLIMWKADLGGNLGTEISVSDERVFASAYFGDSPGNGNFGVIREIDPESGLPYWQVSERHRYLRHFAAETGSLVISYSDEGVIQKIGPGGTIDWELDLGTSITSNMSLEGGDLLVGTGNKTVVLVDRDNGKLISQINISGVPNAVAANSKYLLAGDSEGNVYGFNGSRYSGLWRAKTGGGINGISIFEDEAIVTSKDNFVYSIDTGNGKKKWKRKLAGRIYGMAQIDAVHAVFTTSGSNTAVILNLLDGRLVNKHEFDQVFVSAPVKIKGGFAIATGSSVTAVSNTACGN